MLNSNNTQITKEDQIMFLEDISFMEGMLKKKLDGNFDKNSSVTIKGGRPYKNSPKELAERGVEYLRRSIQFRRPVTITGLSIALGASRRQLINWESGRPDDKGNYNQAFNDVVVMLKNFVGYYYETMGERAKNPYFFIFILSKLWRLNSKN